MKEQLKKRGSFEFYKTSFSYIDLQDDTERSVGVPEQGGAGVVSPRPAPAGNRLHCGRGQRSEGRPVPLGSLLLPSGTGKLRTPTGLEKSLKESLNRAFSYLQNVKDKLGLTELLAQKDVYAEAVDLSGGRIECPCGVAFFAAMISAVRNRTGPGRHRGSRRPDHPGQPSKDRRPSRSPFNCRSRAERCVSLVPVSNKTQFAGLSEDVIERLDVVFYGDRRSGGTKDP